MAVLVGIPLFNQELKQSPLLQQVEGALEDTTPPQMRLEQQQTQRIQHLGNMVLVAVMRAGLH
jgi:hypothetical protein